MRVVLVLLGIVLALKLGFWFHAALRRYWMRRMLRTMDEASRSAVPTFVEGLNLLLDSPPDGVFSELLTRLNDPAYPLEARLYLMRPFFRPQLDPIARRLDDPLAPHAWLRGLEQRWNENHMHAGVLIRVRSEVKEEQLRELWTRALGSTDSWALPPELEIHELYS